MTLPTRDPPGNVKVLWEDNSETWEPLSIIKKDDPVSVATYAENNGLLNKPGWKSLRHIIKNKKVHQQLINQAQLKSQCYSSIYQFGSCVPRNPREAFPSWMEPMVTRNGKRL